MATLENFLSTVADQTDDFRVLYELGSLRALQKRIEALEAQVKLADALINGPDDDHMGMAMCLDGYYGECFAENLKEWDRLMGRSDE